MTDATPGGPISVALALLDQQWPDAPALGEETATELERDPRYVIGRLQQALTALLATELPPMDSETSLLSQALADAIAWRLHNDRPCPRCAESLCDPCNTDWDQADRYHVLARALGAVGDPSRAKAPKERQGRRPVTSSGHPAPLGRDGPIRSYRISTGRPLTCPGPSGTPS